MYRIIISCLPSRHGLDLETFLVAVTVFVFCVYSIHKIDYILNRKLYTFHLQLATDMLDVTVLWVPDSLTELKVLVWLWHPEIRKQMFQAFLRIRYQLPYMSLRVLNPAIADHSKTLILIRGLLKNHAPRWLIVGPLENICGYENNLWWTLKLEWCLKTVESLYFNQFPVGNVLHTL